MIYLKKGIFVIKIVVLPFYSQFTHKLSTTIGYESYFMSAKITYGCFFLFMFIVEIDRISLKMLKAIYINSDMKLSTKIILVFFFTAIVLAEEQHDHHQEEEEGHLNQSQIWGFGFLAGLAVSLIGFIAAFIVLVLKKCCNQNYFALVIKFLFSLACGALIGDSFVHILAEAYHSDETESSIVSVIVICSIAAFVILEKLFESFGVSHSHWVEEKKEEDEKSKNQVGDEHSSNKLTQSKKQILEVEDIKDAKVQMTDSKIKQNVEGNEEIEAEGEKKNCCKQFAGKGTTGYLNLIASLLHNFIDGLAIGVAFSTGESEEFIPVLIAIIVHEIPRQMGDVAVLLKNDFSQTQTIICNGTINLISLVGTFIGLGITHLDHAAKSYLLVFIAGNFIFIAADIWRNLFKNKNAPMKNVLEFFGLALGVGVMFLLLLLEEEQGHAH